MDHREVEDNYMAHQQAGYGALHATENGGTGGGSIEMVEYMLNTPPAPPQQQISLDRLSFAEVMQFADFRPKLPTCAGQPMKISGGDEMESCFFRFPSFPSPSAILAPQHRREEEEERVEEVRELEEEGELGLFSDNTASSVQQQSGFGDGLQGVEGKNRRKRARSMKTSEEVESQRMTHIAVERNRRRQMNDHLRVLRSLMPSSYVQRGDQASIIGGAIEFVRELEQLLQCLESQKRRRLYGNGADASLPLAMQQQPPPSAFFPPLPLAGGGGLEDPDGGGLREDMAENKSCLADIEVRLLGLDAMIKILSRRRPGQLLKTIAALEDLQLSILHTNVTTIEQTVLYSFNVKITGEARCTAEEIGNSVQHILGFIDSSTLSSEQY